MFLLLIIAIATISYEFVNSSLVLDVKRVLKIDKEHPAPVLLSSFKIYRKVLGKLAYVLLPLIVPVMTACLAYRLLVKVSSCSYCLSFWVSLILFLFVFHQSILVGIAYAGTTLLVTSLYNLIRYHTV